MEQGVWWVQILKGVHVLFLSYKSTEMTTQTHYFHTNTSFFGFPDMVLKGESFDPYDPPLDPPLLVATWYVANQM